MVLANWTPEGVIGDLFDEGVRAICYRQPLFGCRLHVDAVDPDALTGRRAGEGIQRVRARREAEAVAWREAVAWQ